MKQCSRCRKPKLHIEFGVDRARDDGLNIYCKPCVRQRNIDTRLARRGYDATRRPREVVLAAIRRGAKDQRTIQLVTRLRIDEICDALADLWAEDKLDRSALKRREYRMAA